MLQRQHGAGAVSFVPAAERVVVTAENGRPMAIAFAESTLRITVVDADEQPVAGVRLRLVGDRIEQNIYRPTDAAGRTEVAMAPGTVMVQALPRDRAALPEDSQLPVDLRWIDLGVVTATEPRVQDVKLRLPGGICTAIDFGDATIQPAASR